MSPSILIITYYWPPAGGPGVQRWLKLSKYLSQFGVKVHILTVDEEAASYYQWDKSLAGEVHPETVVHKTNSFEIIKWYEKLVGKEKVPTSGFHNVDNTSFFQKAANAIRSNIFIPDPRKGWKKYALRKARTVIKATGISTIISTGPPHSTHLIGMQLQKEFQLRWIADFRDPWTDIYYYTLLNHSRFSAARDKKLELQVLRHADKVTTVSYGFRNILRGKLDASEIDKFTVIHNGYDAADFAEREKMKDWKTFDLCYTGTISDQYYLGKFPEVLDSFCRNKGCHLRLTFVGTVAENIKKNFEGKAYEVVYAGTVPHEEATKRQGSSDLLLYFTADAPGNEGIVHAKLYEYMASGNPVFAIAPKGGDAERILGECRAGRSFNGKEEEEMLAYLNEIYSLFESQKYPANKPTVIKKYTRESEAREFLGLLV